MAEFINFETEIDDLNEIDDDKIETIDDNISENSFVNDTEIDNSRSSYRQFTNVENDLDEVLSNIRDEGLQEIEEFD